MTEPRTAQLHLRSGPKFREWFKRERARRNITAREFCDLLALHYVLSSTKKKDEVTPWPLD